MRRKSVALLTAMGLASAVVTAPASAATLGQTVSPVSNCSSTFTFVQTESPGATPYAAPQRGVITSWRFEAGATPPILKFKVIRLSGANDFLVVGEDGPRAQVPSSLNMFAARIPVEAGDVIGFTTIDSGHCIALTAGFSYRFAAGDPAPGTGGSFTGTVSTRQLDVSAVLEPDCDGDGFGDETQDSDTSACSPPPPDTIGPSVTITDGPKNKTRKKKAKFKFTGTDARALAGFQCRVDDDAFEPCTSPHKVKVKKGRHTFEVQAVDDSGNVGSPESDRWKRKKKRKK